MRDDWLGQNEKKKNGIAGRAIKLAKLTVQKDNVPIARA